MGPKKRPPKYAGDGETMVRKYGIVFGDVGGRLEQARTEAILRAERGRTPLHAARLPFDSIWLSSRGWIKSLH
jgi:hypothetical protein